MARFISGTASSILSRSLFISPIMRRISASWWIRVFIWVLLRRDASSAFAAFARRRARDCISQRRALVKDTADSSDVLPLAELYDLNKRKTEKSASTTHI